MKKSSFTMLISELSEEDRRSAEQWVERLPKVFRECEAYLRDYKEGKQNAIKLLQELAVTMSTVDEAQADLANKHNVELHFPLVSNRGSNTSAS
jgi:hypothetical protein